MPSVDVPVPSNEQIPQLVLAIKDKERVISLLETGADVNLPSLEGITDRIRRSLMGTPIARYPIEFASAVSSLEIVQLLLNRGAKLEGTNALHAAAGIGSDHYNSAERIKVMELLLENGANIDAIEFESDREFAKSCWKRTYGTPLQYAAAAGWEDGVKFLLERGADKEILGLVYHTDQRWGTALDWQKLSDEDEGYHSARVLKLLGDKKNIDAKGGDA